MIMNPIISGTSLPELTTPATEGQILTGRQAIDQNGEILTGSMPEITVPNPTISVSNSGLITASLAYSSGHTNGGTASNTYQLTTQAARTITPSRSSQTAVASGRYTTGNITVAGDSDLIASNIKSGVNIFGVTGSYSGPTIQRVALSGNDSSISANFSKNSRAYISITPPSPIKELCNIAGSWQSDSRDFPRFFCWPCSAHYQDDLNNPVVEDVRWDIIQDYSIDGSSLSADINVSSNEIRITNGALLGEAESLYFVTYSYIPA